MFVVVFLTFQCIKMQMKTQKRCKRKKMNTHSLISICSLESWEVKWNKKKSEPDAFFIALKEKTSCCGFKSGYGRPPRSVPPESALKNVPLWSDVHSGNHSANFSASSPWPTSPSTAAQVIGKCISLCLSDVASPERFRDAVTDRSQVWLVKFFRVVAQKCPWAEESC